MPDKIIHLRSLTPGSVPTTSSIGVGEFAINVPDGKAFLRKSGSGVDTVETVLVTNSQNTGNLVLTGSLIVTDVTSSLYGTASWALTASYALNAAGSPNLDGGLPDSNYGGSTPINGGTV